VTKVSDGDTITVETRESTKLKVRLYGIDAPETEKINRKTGRVNKLGQPYGDESEKYLASLVLGKTVRLDIIDIDRYRRMVSVVWLGERNINLEMVKAGMAEVYVEYLKYQPYRDQFLRAEREAKLKRLGIWSQGNMYERPNEFRKRMKVRGE
jgi:endonuclease YncB( thermonuclease family)